MRVLHYGLMLAGAIGIAGCATSSQIADNTMMPEAECVFPHTNQSAPNWICDESVPGLAVSAVGIAERTKGGVAFQKDLAGASAMGQLADQFKVQADKMVKQYLGSTGVGDAETIDTAAESVIKTVSSVALSGARRYKSRTGPEGRMYILMGLDSENTAKAVETTILTSMRNEKAAWQRFLAEKSFAELAKEIASQQVR